MSTPGIDNQIIEGDLTVLHDLIVAGTVSASSITVDSCANAHKWDNHLFGDWLNQSVRTTDSVQFASAVLGQLASANYASGSAGWKIDSNGNIEANNVNIRGSFSSPELRVNRLFPGIGLRWYGPGWGEIQSVTVNHDSYGAETDTGTVTLRLVDEESGEIAVGDLCMGIFHSTTPLVNSSDDYDDSKGNFRFKGFFTSYFKVTSVSGANNNTFTYQLRPQSATWAERKHPCALMRFVAYGNATNTARQASQYFAPKYSRYLCKVNTWDLSALMISAQFGDLTNLSVHNIDTNDCTSYIQLAYQPNMTELFWELYQQTESTPNVMLSKMPVALLEGDMYAVINKGEENEGIMKVFELKNLGTDGEPKWAVYSPLAICSQKEICVMDGSEEEEGSGFTTLLNVWKSLTNNPLLPEPEEDYDDVLIHSNHLGKIWDLLRVYSAPGQGESDKRIAYQYVYPDMLQGTAGKVLAVNSNRNGVEWKDIFPSYTQADANKLLALNAGGTAAVWKTFLSYLPSMSGKSGKVLKVNSNENGIEWGEGGGGGTGSVTSVSAGTGLATSDGQPITSTGTISISTEYRGFINEAYTHSQLADGSNPHATTFANIASKPTTIQGYGITGGYFTADVFFGGQNSPYKITSAGATVFANLGLLNTALSRTTIMTESQLYNLLRMFTIETLTIEGVSQEYIKTTFPLYSTQDISVGQPSAAGGSGATTLLGVWKTLANDPSMIEPVSYDNVLIHANHLGNVWSLLNTYAYSPTHHISAQYIKPWTVGTDELKVLRINSDGTDVEWAAESKELPTLIGSVGKVLKVGAGAVGVEWADTIEPTVIGSQTKIAKMTVVSQAQFPAYPSSDTLYIVV